MSLHDGTGPILPAAAVLLGAVACGGATTAPEPEPADEQGAGGAEASDRAEHERDASDAPRVPDVLIAFAPCTSDYRALCTDVDPEDGAAVIGCLREHRAALGRHCLAALDPEAPQTRSSRCVAAIEQRCPDANDPHARTECIRRFDELEPICQRPTGGPGGPQGPGAGPGGGAGGMGGGFGGAGRR